MKKILNILYSTRLTGTLFLVFGIAMGIATFIESKYGTQTSKADVYNTWWFELIMLLFLVNFFGNMFRYRLFRKEKITVLLFHLAFVLIIVGAGITRYISSEGIMPIKEGQSTNLYLSDKTYLTVNVDNNKVMNKKPIIDKAMLFSAMTKNKFSKTFNFKDKTATIKLKKYIPYKEDKKEYEFLHFVESSTGQRQDHYIKKGESQVINYVKVGFDNTTETNAINFYSDKNGFKIKTPHGGDFLRMRDNFEGTVAKDSLQNFNLLSLYSIAGLKFVVPSKTVKGSLADVGANEQELDKLVFEIKSNGKTKEISVLGKKYLTLNPDRVSFEGLNYQITYGAKQLELPFHIKLKDFQLENYPGSQSPMSYASEIQVISPKKTFDYRIFMNHILDFKGYRFFQSSYEINDQYEETRLSVNQDFWGTWVTYIGYFLLFGAMILTLFMPKTRFGDLGKQLKKIKSKRTELGFVIALLLTLNISAQNHHLPQQQLDSILQANVVEKTHTDKFAKLVIQDAGGRMKPVNTFASELLRKIYKKNKFKGLDANQVFISMLQNKRLWFDMPMIYLEKGDDKVREIIGINKKEKYARLSDFFTDKIEYKLRKEQEKAFKTLRKSVFQNDIINIDKRVNLLFSALEGSLFRVFPIVGNKENKWISPFQDTRGLYKGIDSVFVKQIIPIYTDRLHKANISKDYTGADEILDGMIKFQKKFGAAVYPNQKKIDLEIAYNKFDVFKKIYGYYFFLGILFILFLIIHILYNNKVMKFINKTFIALILLTFIAHTGGLLARWYISGHAPWSDAYETVLYISWSVMVIGLALTKKSHLTLAAATFLAGLILFFAHRNYLDPAIANLVPVLNSYWLMIHVAVIVASYGPFFLAGIVGFISLFLMLITNKKNKEKLDLVIKELTIINELSITVGIVMLTIGVFLGGMWANESWGRYWGWDPKETWALISIMFYAFVLHMRLIPGLRSRFIFNFLSVVGWFVILMTYMGVNFYLTGLHSYGSVDGAKETPTAVINFAIFVIIFGTFAFLKYKKYYKK